MKRWWRWHETARGLDFEEGAGCSLHDARAHQQLHRVLRMVFRLCPRLTQDELRVAEALDALPELARELREGALNFSQVRELTLECAAGETIIALRSRVATTQWCTRPG